MTEEWRPIKGFEGKYEVSSQCRIRRLPQPGVCRTIRVLRKRLDKKGYVRVALHDRGRTDAGVHRLVASAFIGPPPSPEHQVNHIDGDKQNNAVENLEWTTGVENVRHSWRIGLRTPLRGEQQGRAKLTWATADEIRRSDDTTASLARQYGVSTPVIDGVRKGTLWREEHRPAGART